MGQAAGTGQGADAGASDTGSSGASAIGGATNDSAGSASGGDAFEAVSGAGGSGAGSDLNGAAGAAGASVEPDPVGEIEPALGWKALIDGRINSGAANANAPRLAFDSRGNGVAFAIWTASAVNGDDVYVSRFAQSGWSEPLSLTPGSALGTDPQIAADGKGNAVAIWRQPDGAQHVIFTARYSATTSNWGAPQQMQTEPGLDADAPAIGAEGDGYVLATWRMIERQGGNIASTNVAVAELDGSVELADWQFRAPLAVGTGALTGSPRLALNRAGNGFVVWDQVQANQRVIYAARYARGVGFDPALELGSSDFDADSPDVAVTDNGDALTVWRQRGSDGSWGISLNHFAAIANGWAPENAPLTQHAPDVGAPHVACTPQGAFTSAWWQLKNGKRSLFASRGTLKVNGEGGWDGGALIENDDRGDVSEPAVTVRKDGTGLVVWAQSNGVRDQIVIATSVTRGWQLGTLQQDVTRQASAPFIAAVPGSNQALALWAELAGPAPAASNIVGANFTAE